jgi:hypothetical protein
MADTTKITLYARLIQIGVTLQTLTDEIMAAYPTADAIEDSLELAASHLEDAQATFNDFDPDASTDDEEIEDSDPNDDELA